MPLGKQPHKERNRENRQVWATETGIIKKKPREQDPQKNVIIDVLGGWSEDLEKLRDDKHLWKSRKACFGESSTNHHSEQTIQDPIHIKIAIF